MKRRLMVAAVLMIASSCLWCAAGTTKKKSQSVSNRLCGVVDHVEYVPAGTPSKELTQKKTPLGGVPLTLYVADKKSACCEALRPMMSISTREHGDFDLNEVTPGNYWLSMRWNERDYKSLSLTPFRAILQ